MKGTDWNELIARSWLQGAVCRELARSWLQETWFFNRENFRICNKHFVWNEDWTWKNLGALPRSRNCGHCPCSVCGTKLWLKALRSYCLGYERVFHSNPCLFLKVQAFGNFRISHEFWKVGTSFQSCSLSQNVKGSFQTEHDAKETTFGLHNR